jgi:predicted enzyme related to lactoylglutathione lyase
MANPFVHIELQTQDVERSEKFYWSLFDRKLEEMPGTDCTIVNKDSPRPRISDGGKEVNDEHNCGQRL